MGPKSFKPLDIPSQDSFDFAKSFKDTDIPPPPPSPTPAAKPVDAHNGAKPATPTSSTKSEGKKDGAATTQTQGANPAQHSPASSGKGRSSIRKLLSLRSLRDSDRSHANNGLASPTAVKQSTDMESSRPGSPYATQSIMSDGSKSPTSKRRSSGWFGSRRRSQLLTSNGRHEGGAVQPPFPQKPKGPPPPTIPEFKEFGSINGALSGTDMEVEDLFKNIK